MIKRRPPADRDAAPVALRYRAALAATLAIAVVGCGRAGGTPEDPSSSIHRQANKPVAANVGSSVEQTLPARHADPSGDERVARLERLLKRSTFDAFVDAALEATGEQPASAAVELLKVEALLATGRSQDAQAAAQRAAQVALDVDDYELASHALRRFALARFRQSEPLEGPSFDTLAARFPRHDATVAMLRFWSDSLGQRKPYSARRTGNQSRQVAPAAKVADTDAAGLNAIAAGVNDVPLDTVFIDTGAQHAVMTVAAAEAAGVRPGPSGLRLVGFANLAARPGLIDTLDLGGVVLHDVPVMIGDSAPLAAAGGQMALGTELMHHVRFTMDYPAGRVLVEPANSPRAIGPADGWEIPLWTFSQACLAQGHLPSGETARVLVDTGDASGSYVSGRWAQRHLPGFPRQHGPVVFKSARRKLSLGKMELGTGRLDDWPVVDTLPVELERADAIDVLLGRDLLASYRVTIDMSARVLRLQGAAASSATNGN
jgi:hypothetical protein